MSDYGISNYDAKARGVQKVPEVEARAVGGTAGAIQQAGMRAIRLGARMEW